MPRPAGQLWADALRAVAALRPYLATVGHEHGTGLAAARQAGARPSARFASGHAKSAGEGVRVQVAAKKANLPRG